MSVEITSNARPRGMGVRPAMTADGEDRIIIRFNHGNFTNVEAITPGQARWLSETLAKYALTGEFDFPANGV